MDRDLHITPKSFEIKIADVEVVDKNTLKDGKKLFTEVIEITDTIEFFKELYDELIFRPKKDA